MELDVQADRIAWVQGEAVADGHVLVIFGDQRLEGQRAVWSPGKVVVEDGVYSRPEGVFAFDRAEIDLSADTAVVWEARLQTGNMRLDLGEVKVQPGLWEGQRALLEPCACSDGKPGALSFSVGRVEVIPERVVILHNGLLRVFQIPVLPIPYARLPLDPDRFRLLFPELSYGSNGFSAGWAGTGAIHGWRLTGGPMWRQDRGFRAELAVEGPGNFPHGASVAPVLQAQGGWDNIESRLRGAYSTHGGYAAESAEPGLSPLRFGWDGALLSDPTYAEDFGLDWLSRGVAWRDQRLTATWGPERLSLWLPDDASPGPVASLTQQIRLGQAISLSPALSVQAWSIGDRLLPREELTLRTRGAGTYGPLSGRFALEGRASAFGIDDRQTSATADGALELAFWGDAPGWRALWRPGVRVEGEASRSWDLLTSLTPLPSGRIGPGLGLTLLHDPGTLVLDAQALYGNTGWTPRFRLDLGIGPMSGYLDAQADVQTGRLRWDTEVWGLGLASTHAEGLWLLSGDTSLHWRRLRTGGGLAADLDSGQWAGASVQLGYDDGCTAALLTTRFSPDREIPDIGVQMTVRR